jgi:hypothetical protein
MLHRVHASVEKLEGVVVNEVDQIVGSLPSEAISFGDLLDVSHSLGRAESMPGPFFLLD